MENANEFVQYYTFNEWLSVVLFVPLLQHHPDIYVEISGDEGFNVHFPGMRTTTNPVSLQEVCPVMETEKQLPPPPLLLLYLPPTDTSCPICLNDDKQDDAEFCNLACGHTFHTECVGTWLAHRPQCPCCRAFVKPEFP
jgi:hypothetical protein